MAIGELHVGERQHVDVALRGRRRVPRRARPWSRGRARPRSCAGAADRARHAAIEGKPGDAGIGCGARQLDVGHGGAARRRCPGSTVDLARSRDPGGSTTPGTPPSRTSRLEPRPMTTTGPLAAGREEIGEIGLVGRREQHLRRATDAKPRDVGQRSVGDQRGRAVAACAPPDSAADRGSSRRSSRPTGSLRRPASHRAVRAPIRCCCRRRGR